MTEKIKLVVKSAKKKNVSTQVLKKAVGYLQFLPAEQELKNKADILRLVNELDLR